MNKLLGTHTGEYLVEDEEFVVANTLGTQTRVACTQKKR